MISSGDGTIVTGAGSTLNPYVIDGTSNIVLSDSVPVVDPPAEDYPAIAVDPDTGVVVAYFVPGDAWHAVAGGSGGVEVYKGEGDPNDTLGDPGVPTAIYYDFGTPETNGAEVTDTYPYCIWIWNDTDEEWKLYPNAVMATTYEAGSTTCPTDPAWTSLVATGETFDTAKMHQPGSNRIYVPYEGYYRISGRVTFEGATDAPVGQTRKIRLKKNGTDTLEFAHAYPIPTTTEDACLPFNYDAVYLVAGDYVRVEVQQNSGGNMNCTLEQFTVKLQVPVAPPVGS